MNLVCNYFITNNYFDGHLQCILLWCPLHKNLQNKKYSTLFIRFLNVHVST